MPAGDNTTLLAPLSGVVVPIASVPDPVFSQGMVGDGISIDPTSQTVLAPCAATVTRLHSARHAITLTTAEGVEILIHAGLDTVSLKGKGFKAHVKEGDKVTPGQPLLEFDADHVLRNATSLLTQIVVTNGEVAAIVERVSGLVKAGESRLMTVKLRQPAGAGALPESPAGEGDRGGEASVIVILPNPNGLHARPAALLANKARSFTAEIRAELGGKSANAKSLGALLGLGAGARAELRIRASGADAARAITELTDLILGGLGEDLAAAPAIDAVNAIHIKAAPSSGPAPARAPADDARHLHGVTAAPGLAVGPAFKLAVVEVEVEERAGDLETEIARLSEAISHARIELTQLAARASAPIEQTEIFGAHVTMLEDPETIERAHALMQKGKSAGFAFRAAVQWAYEQIAALDNPLLAARAHDVQDVGRRVLLKLAGRGDALAAPAGSIVLAEDLSPSDVLKLAHQRVAGIATVLGGTTSHAAILARSVGLPFLVGVSPELLTLSAGMTIVLDADGARILVALDEARLATYRQQIEARAAVRETNEATAQERAATRDGVHVEVLANIASESEASEAVRLGAEGVGLLRTELMFLDRATEPPFAEQVAAYEAIAAALGKRLLTVRTLDVGGDKPLPYLPLPAEDNPLLGLRGLRIGWLHPKLLRDQLRAILSARSEGRVRIMLPMVSSIEELREAKRALADERQRVGGPQVELGVMVEVPSVAIQADLFAAEADFFSIGTNDLTQYTLAMDRTHPGLASRQDALHPAVLRLIEATVRAGRKHKKPVGVCGALASDPGALAVLVGLGVTDLSVAVRAIPDIKAKIRNLDAARCRELAASALELGNAAEVRALVARFEGADKK